MPDYYRINERFFNDNHRQSFKTKALFYSANNAIGG